MEIKIYNMELDAAKHPTLVMERKVKYGCNKFNDPSGVVDLCNTVLRMDHMAEEQVWMLALDTKGNYLGLFRVSHGTANKSFCHPREIYIRALISGAAAIIIIHNHPSSDCLPSKDDKDCCNRMIKAGKLIGIALVDFIIIGDGYFSFLEQGEIKYG